MKTRHAGLAVHLVGPRLLAVVAFVALAVAAWRPVGLAAAAAALVLVWWVDLRRRTPSSGLEYTLVLAGLLALYAHEARYAHGAAASPTLIAAGLAGLALLIDDPVVRKITGRADEGISGVNLPQVAGRRRLKNAATIGNPLLVVAIGSFVLLSLPVWTVAAAVALLAALHCSAVAEAVLAIRRSARGTQRLHTALASHRPAFLVYFSAPPGSGYQVTMWLPYLERVGVPFAVVVRERESVAVVGAATRAPVLFCPTIATLDSVVVPSVRAVFYVNNGMKNTHMVRFQQLTHVQLLHGDSEKPPSYNPVTAMYDRVFVAGQAAIDRYAHRGVTIPAEKFRIVGRPQVEAIQVATAAGRPSKVVLYAPTWTGYYSDTNSCSLPVAVGLIELLLEHGATVVFRPHPYSRKHAESARRIAAVEERLSADKRLTGRPHVWGSAAGSNKSLVDCFNEADALVTDISSVANDFLYSEKPLAIVDMSGGSGQELIETLPLASAAYVIPADLRGAREILEQLLVTDPRQEARRAAKVHYLGPFAPDGYADAFVQAVRDEIGTGVLPAPRRSPVSATDGAAGAATATQRVGA